MNSQRTTAVSPSMCIQSLLRSPRSCLSGSSIEGDCLTDERLERRRVDFISLVYVDRAPCIPFEAGVEEFAGVFQRSTLGEGQLHFRFVGFAGADDPVVRPDGRAHPLPFLDDVGVRLLDELAHPALSPAAPVRKVGDSLV